MREKRAVLNLTIGKLLRYILLVLVLVLVVYGVSTKGLNPLIEKIGVRFDEVLILFNFKEGVSSDECYSENVVNFGGGKDFLKDLELEGEDVILNVCRNGICNISGEGLGSYRTVEGSFEKLKGKEWEEYNSLFSGGTGLVKFNWELYNKGVDILEEASVRDLYDKGFTRQFILYGDGNFLDSPTRAIWANGRWKVGVDGGEFKIYEDDDEAIDAFVDGVRDNYNDEVYYKESGLEKSDGVSEYGELIGNLVGDAGDFDEIDKDEDVRNLKIEFARIKEKLFSEVRASDDDVDRLRKVVEGKNVTIGNKEFIVGVDEGEEYPIVSFVSGDEKFGLRHSAYAEIDSELVSGVKLRYFPVSLVKWDGSAWKEIGNGDYYRLPKDDFKEVYEATLISQFLKSKCR